MADLLNSLPVDETPLNHDEIHILQTLFKDENVRDLSTIFIELKDAVIGGVLFAILSSSKVDDMMRRFMPNKSHIIMICVKTLIFIGLFWIIVNFALAKR